MVGICMMINSEMECEDSAWVPGFTSETACEVHSILSTTLINYDLYHIDGIYDTFTAPSECVDIPMRPDADSAQDFFKDLTK